MKIFAYLFFFCLSNIAYSQDSSSASHKVLKHGIEFQIDRLLELRSFGGYTLSYRYHFDQNSGLRLGFYIFINKDDYDLVQQSDSIINKPPSYNNYFSLKLSVQYLSKLMNWDNFSLFWGGGPFVLYDNSDAHSEALYSNSRSIYKQKTKTFGFGLDMLLGVDYGLAENVFLSGEYLLGISYKKSDIDNKHSYEYYDGTTPDISNENGKKGIFNLSGSSVRLGLAVFF